MARKKVENADPPAEPAEADAQTEIDGTKQTPRPAEAGVRFSLAEAGAELKSLTVKAKLQDDEGDLLSLRAKLVVTLVSSDVQFLPEIADAVSALLELGQSLPKKSKNQFALSLGREFAGALYTITGKPGRVAFNAQVDGTPSVRVVKGSASLVLPLAFTVREPDFRTLTKYLAERPKVTVEPPQQELDFTEAA